MNKAFKLALAAILISVLPCVAAKAQTGTETPKSNRSSREEIIKAYKKEFAFIESEKLSLKKRLRQMESERAKKISQAEREISALQDELLKKAALADEAQYELEQIREATEDREAVEEALETTIFQAMQTLEKHDVAIPEFDEDDSEAKTRKIEFIFSRVVEKARELGSVRKKQGEFFLTNGARSQGDIIMIGNVAAMGISDKESGTLAPAGGGLLKMWDPKAAEEAKVLAAGESPEVLPLYLYESLEKSASQAEGKSASEVIKSGGVIAYVIVGLGVAAFFMILGRAYFLFRSASNTVRLMDRIAPYVQKGQLAKALELCGPEKGASARVMAATIRNLDSDPDHLEDVISESILHETPYLERFETAITVFAAVAPLLGLLGTVTGMISTFDVITEYGTGDPKLLSGGISEALVTTQLGLTVAIPTLLAGSLLSGWSNRIKEGMEHAALRLTNLAKGFKPVEAKEQAKPVAGRPAGSVSNA